MTANGASYAPKEVHMLPDDNKVPRPQEQLPIPLFDSVVLAARATDGHIYLGLRDLCHTLGLDPSSQRRRIVADESLHLTQFRVQVERQFRTLDFLLLEDVPVWLLSVQQRRVAPAIRERFAYVKAYLVNAVQQAFAQLTGLPQVPSNAVEDLQELDRIDQAFTQLAAIAQRQESLESSQDRARSVFRDMQALIRELHERVQALEQQARTQINPQQRGTLYHMVQRWGQARAGMDAQLAQGVAIRKSWSELNARFGISTYTDLPSARYDEAVQFIKQQYRTLTGEEIDAVEQRHIGDDHE